MQKSILTITAFTFLFLVNSAQATESCSLKAYGKTVQEAFRAGAELAERTDGGKNVIDTKTVIRILPEKENGLFAVEVIPHLNRGYCPVDTSQVADEIHTDRMNLLAELE